MHKKLLLPALFFILFAGCSNPESNQNSNAEETGNEAETVSESAVITTEPVEGKIMLIVKIKTQLPEEELTRRAKERAPQFEALPGLVQKYYTKTGVDGEYRGVYIWDSMESLQSYRESDLAKTIAAAYEATEPPVVEKLDIMFKLRE